MYTIAAIDDEVPAIQCIEKILQGYNRRPYRLVTARSGKEALAKLSRQKPDLLLVDIEMQDMDGFQLIDAIHASCNPEAKVIMVTAYSQFDYCKKAIERRAFDYILKPVKEGELLTAIERAFKELEVGNMEREDRRNIGTRNCEQSLQHYLKNRDLEYVRTKAFQEAMTYLHHPTYVCAAVRVSKHEGNGENPSERLKQLLLEKTGIRSEWSPRLIVLETAPLELAVIGGVSGVGDWHAMIETLRNASVELRIWSMGVGTAFSDLGEIAERLDQCVQASRQQLLEPGGSLARLYRAIEKPTDVAVRKTDLRPTVSIVADQIALGEEDAPIALLDCLRRDKYVDYPAFRETLLYLLTRMQQIAYEHGANLEPVSQLEAVVSRSQTVEEIAQWAAAQAEEIIRHIRLSQSTNAWRKVHKVIAHIDLHYREQLTLNDVAAMASVHTAYFCDLFKKITGETYVEYLTRLRIEKAKQLLAEGRLSVAKLADRVGYEDPNYFRRVFRKYTGMTPRQYRKRFV